MRRRGLWLYASATAAATLLFTVFIVVQHRLQGGPTSWTAALLRALPACVLLALLCLPILRLAPRLAPERLGWTRAVLVHAPLAILFALSYVVLRGTVHFVFFSTDSEWLALLRLYQRRSFGIGLLVYGLAAATAMTLEYRRGYARARARAAELERELSRQEPPPPAEPPAPGPSFIVKTGTRTYAVPADEVDWIEAERNYVSLHVGERVHLVRETMKGVEEKLDPARFVRIHRSVIVNVQRVSELRTASGGEWATVLRNGAELRTSRSGRARLLQSLGSQG